MKFSFKPYTPEKEAACLALFDANCPEYFAPNERDDFETFLAEEPNGYTVVESDSALVAAYGLIENDDGVSLNWIMLDPQSQGGGLGTTIMELAIAEARGRELEKIHIAASQKSAPFFVRFGAEERKTTPDGWGPGMDRIDMELRLVSYRE